MAPPLRAAGRRQQGGSSADDSDGDGGVYGAARGGGALGDGDAATGTDGASGRGSPAQAAARDAPPHGGRRRAGNGRELTAWVLKAVDMEEIRLLLRSNPDANRASCGAMLTQLSWLYPRSMGVVRPTRDHVRRLAWQLVDRLLADDDLPVRERIGLVAAMARLGLHDARPDELQVAAAALLLEECLPQMRQPEQFAATAWALAKLGRDPGQQWIADLLDRSRQHLSQLNLAELGNMIWACAKWGFRPGPVWMTLYYRQCTLVLQQLEDEEWLGLTGKSSTPKASASTSRQQATRGGKVISMSEGGSLDPTSASPVASLTSLVWGLAMLEAKLPPELSTRLLAEARARFPEMGGHAYASVAWGLCRLGARPPDRWLADFMEHTAAAAPHFDSGQCYSNIAWALSNWHAEPPDPWLSIFVRASARHIPRLSPDELATLTAGLADMRARPPRAWVSLCLEEFHKRRAKASAPASATTLWAVSRLLLASRQPSRGGAGAGAGDVGGERGAGSGRGLGTPDPVWVQAYGSMLQDISDGLLPSLPTLPAPQLLDILCALSDLGVHPGERWLRAHEAAIKAAMGAMSGYQLNLLARTATAMDMLPPRSMPDKKKTATTQKKKKKKPWYMKGFMMGAS